VEKEGTVEVQKKGEEGRAVGAEGGAQSGAGTPDRHHHWHRQGNSLEGVGGGKSGSQTVVGFGEVLCCIGKMVGAVGVKRGIITVSYRQTVHLLDKISQLLVLLLTSYVLKLHSPCLSSQQVQSIRGGAIRFISRGKEGVVVLLAATVFTSLAL